MTDQPPNPPENQPPVLTVNEVARMVMLTYGKTADGKDHYWCYVAVKPTEYERFMTEVKAGRFNPNNTESGGFGEVVAAGPGLQPPANVTRAVAEAYDISFKEMFPQQDPKELVKRKLAKLNEKEEE